MRFSPLYLLLCSTSFLPGALALQCNICGPGNVIGKPMGVLTIELEGVERKLSCQKWQDSTFLNEGWCFENMPQLAMVPCNCLTSSGEVIAEMEGVATPSVTLPDMIDNEPLECNICGPGNVIGKPMGVLTIELEGVERKQSCQKWEDSTFLNEEWCFENMPQLAMVPCNCLTPSGEVIAEMEGPTTPSVTLADMIANKPELSAFHELLDFARLLEELGNLSKNYTVFAPFNEAIQASSIAINDVENHVFAGGVWDCEELVSMAAVKDTSIESINGNAWIVSVNEEGFPCLGTGQDKACVVACDSAARNGNLHVIDKPLTKTTSTGTDAVDPDEQQDPTHAKTLLFEISSGGNFTCADLGSRCAYDTEDFSFVDGSNGMTTSNVEGDVWAALRVSDRLVVGSCSNQDGSPCFVRCNQGCACVQPNGDDCENSSESGAEGPYSGIVTTHMDPYIRNDCYFEDNMFPHTLSQCECFGSINIVPDDTMALYEQLRVDVSNEIYDGTFPEPSTSCGPRNQALIWLSSGNNRDSGDLYSRYVLAASYYAMNGTRWDSSLLWLSDHTECAWFGLECNSLYGLTSLALNTNNIHGIIPNEIGYLKALVTLSITRNHLVGTIPDAILGLPNLENLLLHSNTLTGTISSGISLSTSLKVLQLGNNLFSGIIGKELGEVTTLEVLNLESNDFWRTIPTQLGQLVHLKHLLLEQNRFSGQLPSELSFMTSLETLRIGNNLLRGTIPEELAKLNKLKDFRLVNTGLQGTLFTEFGYLTSLQYFHLGKNRFSGTLMTELGLLTDLWSLSMDDNSFTGTIPTEIGNLVNLTRLNLADCSFSGPLPSELGALKELEEMTLDRNWFTGSVPQEVCELRQESLEVLVTDCPSTTGSTGVMCSIPDCCSFCRRGDGRDPPAPTTPAPTEPITVIKEPITLNKDYTLEDCMSDLVLSDVNRDQAINKNEYLRFLQIFGSRFCINDPMQDQTLEQQAAFNTIACFCQSEVGASPDCCLGSNAAIHLNGTFFGDTKETEVYFGRVCLISAATLPGLQCQENNTACEEESNCRTETCEAEILALEGCFENQTDLQECAACTGLQSLYNATETVEVTNATVNVCESQWSCKDACGVCYGETNDLTRCVWGCDLDGEESNTTFGTTEPPFPENATNANATATPNITLPPMENETDYMNATTMPPTTPANSTGNIFDRQPEEAGEKEDGPPFGQNVSVVLQGLTRLMNATERTSYVQVTQDFVQKHDPTVQVSFVGQRMVESSSTSSRRRRRLAETKKKSAALEVTTRMSSLKDETPGETASDLIQVNSSNYLEILQQTSETFGAVQQVEIVETTSDENATPVPTKPQAPPPSNEKKKDDNNDNRLWYGLGSVGVVMMLTILVCFVKRRKRRRRPISCNDDDKSLCELDLGDDNSCGNYDNNDLDDSAMMDVDSRDGEDDSQYQYDQDHGTHVTTRRRQRRPRGSRRVPNHSSSEDEDDSSSDSSEDDGVANDDGNY